MFGKKKQQQESYSISPENSLVDGIQGVSQNPINVPNIYQNMPNQVPIQNQQIQQVQYRPPQQFQKQAKIIKGEVNEEGEYYYIVVTNYPLKIDYCQLEN